MFQHRPVGFAQDVQAHLHDKVGPDAEDVAIECRVVPLAEGEAIGDDGLTLGVAIGQDVGGLQLQRIFCRRSGGDARRFFLCES